MIKTIVVGFLVGLLARLLKPGNDSMGWIFTIILGVVGAYVGSLLAGLVGANATAGFAYWVFSVIGAMIVLVIYGFLTNKK
ncbi:GlsB/YeaQ/YmgE family stress response membrane protein [Moraxella sp.]|uniref:GlsB/YeaQ/YmgE family stress response membrane protein n=1 Tax=Moraxella sp. TaxID=479 RepID=UPI0026DC8E5A|nr:GlsB/YeaQ/YmgE family stress response membrane protein [Moraxella sp.]MDO4894880.1 GlsB/YeaQ/YmgE family stress response membrane protein [Moraxella sp.]